MGSCISYCNPKKTSKKNQTKNEECNCNCIEKNDTSKNTITPPVVQDKLVSSQALSISPPSPPKISSSSTTSNYPPTSISTSLCSSMRTSSSSNISTSTSSCSLPSSASSLASCSSIPSRKLEQSFSNDYLWSCVKDNPQFLNEDYHPPIKVTNNPRRNSLPTKSQTNVKKHNRPKEFHGPTPQRIALSHRSAPQKRTRCNSPSNLTRQKSFRREPEVEPHRPISRSGRESRPMSPLSSRRFNGEACNHQGRSLTSSMRRDNSYVRPQSPNKSNNNNSRKCGRSNNNLLVKRENEKVIKEVSSKIEELGMGDLVSNNQDVETMPIEDVNNPHIALDCFIFL